MAFSFRNVNDCFSTSEDPFSAGYSRTASFSPGYVLKPHDVREAILFGLENEKKRIREQLMVVSNAHKLIMKAGLRIESYVERQMAIIRGDHFPFIPDYTVTRYDTGSSTMVPCGVRSVYDGLAPRWDIRESDNNSLIRDSDPTFLEMNPTPELSNKKFKVTFPEHFSGAMLKAETPPPEAKPQKNVSGSKRKAETQPLEAVRASKIPSAGAKKNPMISATKDKDIHKLEQNADDSSIEPGEIIELAALETVKLTSSTEKLNPVSTICKLEGNIHSAKLLEVALIGGSQAKKASTAEHETYKVSTNTGETKDNPSLDQSKPQKNVSGSKRKAETQPLEAVGASNIRSAGAKKNPMISSTKDKDIHKLEKAMPEGNASEAKRKTETKKYLKQVFNCGLCRLVVPDENRFNEHIQERRHKANMEAQSREWDTVNNAEAIIGRYSEQMNGITNADDSSIEPGEIIELADLETVKLTSSTEKGDPVSTICKLEGNIHSGKLYEVARIGGSQAEKASTAEQETYKISTNIGGTKDDPSLDQNADEIEQGAKGVSEIQLLQNTCKSEKEMNNLTDKTLKIGDEKKEVLVQM